MIYYKGTTFTKQRHIGVIVLAKYAMNVSVPNDLAFGANTKASPVMQTSVYVPIWGDLWCQHTSVLFLMSVLGLPLTCVLGILINICKG